MDSEERFFLQPGSKTLQATIYLTITRGAFLPPEGLSHLELIQLLTMMLVLDGNKEIGAHVRSNLCYLIRSRAVTNLIFLFKRPIFLHACATCFEVLCVQEVITPIYIMSYYINWGNYFLDTWYFLDTRY